MQIYEVSHTRVRITRAPFPRSPVTFLPCFATPFTYELNYYAPYGNRVKPLRYRLSSAAPANLFSAPDCSPLPIAHHLLPITRYPLPITYYSRAIYHRQTHFVSRFFLPFSRRLVYDSTRSTLPLSLSLYFFIFYLSPQKRPKQLPFIFYSNRDSPNHPFRFILDKYKPVR